MKKFLSALALFIAPLVIISYPLDYLISKKLAESKTFAHDEYLVWNDIYNGKVNADIVVYGSSRAKFHISPKILEDSLHRTAYNLGVEGQNFQVQYLRHKELLTYNIKPKYIILSVDEFSLQKKQRLFNPQQFLPYLFWNSNVYKLTSSYTEFSFWDYYLPLVRYTGENTSLSAALGSMIVKDHSATTSNKGYKVIDMNWTDDLAKAKSKMEYFEIITGPVVENLFNNFLAECRQQDIKVILVYTPEYIEGQAFVKNRSQLVSLYSQYAKKYNLPFLDYSSDSISMNKKYFYNALHLNKTGAEAFTRMLIRDLRKAPVLQGIAK